MFGSSNNTRGEFQQSENKLTRGVAYVGGGIGAFLCSPQVFDFSSPWIFEYAASHYGYEWAQPATWVWYGVIALGSFFTTRLLISDLLAIGRLRAHGSSIWNWARGSRGLS